MIRNLFIQIYFYNPFKDKSFRKTFFIYLLIVFSTLIVLGIFTNKYENQEFINEILLSIPLVLQTILSIVYYIKNKKRIFLILTILVLLHLCSCFLIASLRILKHHYLDDLLFYLFHSQIILDIFIAITLYFHSRFRHYLKNISILILPYISIFIISTFWNLYKGSIYNLISYIIHDLYFIFFIISFIINIFNPVLIYILSSISKDELEINKYDKTL